MAPAVRVCTSAPPRLVLAICLAWGFSQRGHAQATTWLGGILSKKHSDTGRVFETDDREPVDDTTAFPWSAMGMIQALWNLEAGSEGCAGTGVLISDRVVLTCAHVVYDTETGGPDGIYFIPGKDGSSEPFGASAVVTATVMEGWSSRGDENYDIALLLLDSPVGQQAGHLTVAAKPASFFTDRALNISGYPADLRWDRLYNAFGISQCVEGNLIHHTIDGSFGQSGGPVWYFDEATGEHTVVGVYTGDVEVCVGDQIVEVYGIAVYISEAFHKWIDDFVSEHEAEPEEGGAAEAEEDDAEDATGDGEEDGTESTKEAGAEDTHEGATDESREDVVGAVPCGVLPAGVLTLAALCRARRPSSA